MVALLISNLAPVSIITGKLATGQTLDPGWWEQDLGPEGVRQWLLQDPYMLYLGPVLFDPLDDVTISNLLPIGATDGRFIVQFRSPGGLQRFMETNNELFRILDVLSPLALLVEPCCPGEIGTTRDIWDLRAVIPYHPIFKMESGLYRDSAESGGIGEIPIVIGFYRRPCEDLIGWLKEHTSDPLKIQPADGVMFCTVPVRDLMTIAMRPEVSHISLDLSNGFDNNVAAGIIDVVEVSDTLGLDGSGQFVAIADTGLDTGVNSTLHPDFRGRISSVYTYGRSGNWSDWDIHVWDPVNNQWDYKGGHGTHVAGSVLGNGTMSGGNITGMAPAANIIMQSTMTSTGSLSIPAYNRLFGDAYSSKARIQTNSWSTRGSYGNYTWRSWQTDNFIWNNKDLVVLFSAGNNGGKGPYYVSTQASSKNVIAVGGSENLRPTLSSSANNISEIAYFSSQGYTWGDERIKPDVVAPGTYILSTRSTLITDPANHYWRTYNGSYAYNGGTSMSTPLVAGMATLIREYFLEKEGHDPSAALVKAAVLNGARPLDGKWSSIPNSLEGWGRVNLSNSLGAKDSDAGSMHFIDNSSGVTTGKTHSRLVTVASNRSDLVMTLVWSDYPGSNTSSRKLVNDLDLTLTSPDGTVYHGNDLLSPYNSKRDRNNNVERIRVASPQQGIYVLNVTGYSVTVGPQPYALVMTGDLTRAVGKVYWEQEFVPANGTFADLVLLDSNMTNSGWAHIRVNSSSDGSGDIVNLTEVRAGSAGTGIFRGSVKIVTGNPSPGEVSVSTDEWVTATYRDNYPDVVSTARIRALVQVEVLNVSHIPNDHVLTYKEKMTVKVRGTPGWGSYFDVIGLPSGKDLIARDDGTAPDEKANDGNYTGEFTIPNLIVGNYTLKGYIKRDLLDPVSLEADEPVRINTNVPRMPTDLTVTTIPQGNSLRLEWTSPGDINLMSFSIFRATETFQGSGLPGQFSNIAQTPDNRTYHIDQGLQDGRVYFYRVASFNILGYTSERTPPAKGVPADTMYPWFRFNSPSPGTVLSGLVEFKYTLEEDAKFILFQGAPDPDNDTDPDGPWVDLLNDTSPGGTSDWDTKCCEAELPEGRGFVIRAVMEDEAHNVNVTSVIGIFTIDNTPPPFISIDSPLKASQNRSVYHLFGSTEPLSRVIISRNSQVIRDLSSDEDGNFEAFLPLDRCINSWDILAYDRYGNGPILLEDEIYIVLDDEGPVANVTYSDPITSLPLTFDASWSRDTGPISDLSGIINYTWNIEIEGEVLELFGVRISVNVPRPTVLGVSLELRDASMNLGTWSRDITVIDDIPPIVRPMDDINVFEDSLLELRAPYVIDNDPDIFRVGIYEWSISGPVILEYSGRDITIAVSTPGDYNVTLIVTDTGGGTGSSSFKLKVIDITPPMPYPGQDITVVRAFPVRLSAFGTTDNDPEHPEGYNFTWMVKGLGLTLYGMNVSFVSAMLGEYGILLKVSDRAGNVEFAEIKLEVITDGSPPVIKETLPADGSLDSPPDPLIMITFNEPIDQGSLPGSVHLIGPDGLPVPATVVFTEPDRVVLEPTRLLIHGEEYRIRVTSSLKDRSGEAFSFMETTFRVRERLRVITVQGVGAEKVEREGLIKERGIFTLLIVFNMPPQEDPRITVQGPGGYLAEFPGPFHIGNLTWIILIDGLQEGTNIFIINVTSSFGDQMERPVVFSVQVEGADDPSPAVEGLNTKVYPVIAVVSGLLLLVIALSLIMIRRKKALTEKIYGLQGDLQEISAHSGHPHLHAPYLDPAHPAIVHHHNEPQQSGPHDPIKREGHHYQAHIHDQQHQESGGLGLVTRNKK